MSIDALRIEVDAIVSGAAALENRSVEAACVRAGRDVERLQAGDDLATRNVIEGVDRRPPRAIPSARLSATP
jgi:hypothetical protein